MLLIINFYKVVKERTMLGSEKINKYNKEVASNFIISKHGKRGVKFKDLQMSVKADLLHQEI